VWNGVELVTTYDFIANRTAFKDKPSFDGMQNSPIFSGNITNETSSYIYDANNLRTISLIYQSDRDSYICSNGTGDTCVDPYDR
jgi:hypothetical protein